MANKKTLVRVYVRPQGASFTLNVSGILELVGPTGAVVSVRSANNVALKAQGHPSLESQRCILSQSLNFVLPADWLLPGETTFKLGAALPTLASDPSVAVMDQVNDQTVGVLENARSVVFEEGPHLRVCTVGLRVRDPATGAVHAPQSFHTDSLRSYLQRAFPVAAVEIDTVTVDAAPGFAPPYSEEDMTISGFDQVWQDKFILGCAHLMAIRARDIDAGVDQRTRYYGMVAHPFEFFVGAVSDVPASARPDVIGLGPAIVEAGAYGAHEFAHMLGALHPGFCHGQSLEDQDFPQAYAGRLSSTAEAHHGVDVGDGAEPARLLKFDHYHDVMTYCEPTWVSAYTYRHLLDRLRQEDALGPRGPVGNYLHVIVSYDLDLEPSAGALRYVFPTGTALPDVGSEESNVLIVGENESGVPLFEVYAARKRRDALDLHQQSGAAQLTVPRHEELYMLKLIVNGVVADSMTREAIPQGGPDLIPEGGITLAPRDPEWDEIGGSLTILWPADVAEDRRHTVQVRVQDGPWRTIATGITKITDTVHLDIGWLNPSAPLEVRVLQSYGFLETAIYRGPVMQTGLVTVPFQP